MRTILAIMGAPSKKPKSSSPAAASETKPKAQPIDKKEPSSDTLRKTDLNTDSKPSIKPLESRDSITKQPPSISDSYKPSDNFAARGKFDLKIMLGWS